MLSKAFVLVIQISWILNALRYQVGANGTALEKTVLLCDVYMRRKLYQSELTP